MINQIHHSYKVVSNDKLSAKFYNLRIDAKSILKKIKPGQFVHLKVNDGLVPFFRRPFSIYRAQQYLEIFYEVVGPGTKILSSKDKRDVIDILGPLGNAFTLPSKKITQVVMVAGGIGVAPFLALSDILKKQNIELILLYGGRTKEHVYPMKEFKQNGVKVFIATDDGSVGVKGRVSKLFTKINAQAEKTLMYTCGPKPMMKAVQEFAWKHNIQGQAACEEVMACGIGVCLGCAIKTTEGYKTVCHEGPVFDLQKVIF
ncbi:Dihydroorotate dehydrogenase (NAD(+)), electron transfer subunit [hydrothermal vent metagenome]|uniref:Dihydroorotate dehydrogenase (NAD(+)), electron transfer subunit n=1 Tax=hydrothermal vent metagenome TaxID=652676 RepID=A0A3B1D562_9ZZZZ